MTRVASIFTELRSQRRRALMPFITAGYPSLEATAETIPALERAGASIIELGIPFSDPIADGPVIAESMHKALQTGVTPRQVFEVVRRIRSHTKVGLIVMVSDSIITRMGPEQFVCEAAKSGFDGLIVPDIDLDAAKPLAGLAKLHNLSFTLLVAPTTPPQRIKLITDLCTGFVYVLARVGITGERDQIDLEGLRRRVDAIRKSTDLPIAVGFGISKPEHVAAVTTMADAAIIGSALVRRIGQASANPGEAAKAAGEFLRQFAGK